MNKDKKSRGTITYWLRHNPIDGGIILNKNGWTDLQSLLCAAQKRLQIPFTISDLISLHELYDRPRWEFDFLYKRVRAMYGHSVDINIDGKMSEPPSVLYHGTTTINLLSIKKKGIEPVISKYVHLSEDKLIAMKVCSRKGSPKIIGVESKKMYSNNFIFHNVCDKIWLTKNIPPQYLLFEIS